MNVLLPEDYIRLAIFNLRTDIAKLDDNSTEKARKDRYTIWLIDLETYYENYYGEIPVDKDYKLRMRR